MTRSPDKWGLLAHLGQKAETCRFIANSDEESGFTLTKTSLCYICLVVEELSKERLLLLAATTGRRQNDRNAVTVALRLIKPMGNMPFYKEIIMFEKIQNKKDYKSPSCCTCFYLTDKNKQKNTPTNKKFKKNKVV